MAKNKNKQAQPQKLSPEKYIRLKARNLPIAKCCVSKNWQDVGLAEVLVARRHTNGNYTFAIYVVDTYCIGLKDSTYKFNIGQRDFDEMIDYVLDSHMDISYEEAHNIIYGAISYAEELGIEPNKSFNLTKYILEEDTDDIPLIEYEFGKDGIPYLVASTRFEASKYLPLLEDATGGEYEYTITEEDDFDDDFDDDDFELFDSPYDTIPYSYQHPEYPKELNLIHPELNRLLTSYDDFLLSAEDIDTILSLPRETLITDLQNIILYRLGQDSDTPAIVHALFFLGELRAEEALDTVLEVVRQDEKFVDRIFTDSVSDVMPLTLYYVGRNKLPELQEFMKEPGLYEYIKYAVFVAVNYVANEPGRREEALDWYRSMMEFYKDHADDISVYSASLGGLMMVNMGEIYPDELLPEISSFFEECVVDDFVCKSYQVLEDRILNHTPYYRKYKVMDLYERYQDYYDNWHYFLEDR